MTISELIEKLKEFEKEHPGIEVGLFDTEFGNAEPIRKINAREDFYYNYEQPTLEPEMMKKFLVVLES